MLQFSCTAAKDSKYGVFSSPYSPVFGLNLCTQSKYRKILTRKNSAFGHFLQSDYLECMLVLVKWIQRHGDALGNLVSSVRFKKREKHRRSSFTYSRIAGLPEILLKVTFLHGCFSRFFKLYKWYQITQSVSYDCN